MYRVSKPVLRKALLWWLASKTEREDFQRRFAAEEARQTRSHDWRDGARIGESDDPGPAKQASKRQYGNLSQSQNQKHTIRMKSAPWANPPRRNRVLPASGHSVTYRDALMSRGGRLALPVRGSRFRPPLRYLGHSSSRNQIQNQNQPQAYRGRRVDGVRNATRRCWYGNRCWRGSACPFAHPHRVWRLKHTVVKPQSTNGRMHQNHQVRKKAPFPRPSPEA